MSDAGVNGEMPSFNTDPVGPETDGVQEEELSLASPFLNKIPANDRQVVGRYIKDWDAGVTKKFQEYSSRVKPYEALGPVEELQQYRNFALNFRQNPEYMFKLMYQGLQQQYGDEFEQHLARILELEEEMSDDYEYGDEEEYAPEEGADPNEIFQQNVIQELEQLREWRESFEQQQEDAEGQAQLDSVLDQMHNQYGQFDDNFILLQLSQHGNVEQAIQAWNNLLGQYGSPQQPQRQAPKIMGGQGGVPSGQVNTEQLRGKDRREMVSNMLANLE